MRRRRAEQSISTEVDRATLDGYLALGLSALVPVANFAAVNVGEGVSLLRLGVDGLGIAAAGLLFSLILALVARASHRRAAFATSVLIAAFLCFSAFRLLTGFDGLVLFLAYGVAIIVAVGAGWLSARWRGPRRFWITVLALMLCLSAGSYGIRFWRMHVAAPVLDAERVYSAASTYETVGETAAPIAADVAEARPDQGASILGAGITPREPDATVHVHVVANAYSKDGATAVVALFRNGQKKALALQSKTVPGGGYAVFDLDADISVEARLPLNFEVRVGPALPGTIMINGPDLSAKPAAVPLPSIAVTELPQSDAGPLANRRNVYYLTLDAYPRADVLSEVFAYDNAPFVAALEARGFLVAHNSYANYMATYLSVPSALEQRYAVEEGESDLWNKMPWFLAVVDGRNRVFRHFHRLGYYVAKLNFRDECPPDAFVDHCYRKTDALNPWLAAGVTDVELSLVQMTPLYDILQVFYPDFFKARALVADIDDVERMAESIVSHDPRFVYAHILLPHAPYRFEADCRWSSRIDISGSGSPEPKQRFLDQLRCANRRTIEFVDRIVKTDPDAIILINSDHGSPFTVDWSRPYDQWPATAVRERLGNFDAMRLPPECASMFYDTISPVNYFELVFACIERRQPRFLGDRVYLSTFDKSHPRYGQVYRYR